MVAVTTAIGAARRTFLGLLGFLLGFEVLFLVSFDTLRIRRCGTVGQHVFAAAAIEAGAVDQNRRLRTIGRRVGRSGAVGLGFDVSRPETVAGVLIVERCRHVEQRLDSS